MDYQRKLLKNILNYHQKKIPYIILRLFNIYGAGQDLSNLKQGMISIYLSQALRTKISLLKDLETL